MTQPYSTQCFFWVLAAIVSTAGAAPREAAEGDDLKKMQGDWMVVSMTANGMKYPDEEAQALFRTIEGSNYEMSRYSKAGSGHTVTVWQPEK